MPIYFSSKSKLIKLAEENRPCRLCGVTEGKGSVAVVPYSLEGEPSANTFRKTQVNGCATCNTTGKVLSEQPTFTECNTCRKGSITPGGVGQGAGVYKPNVCPTCYNKGTVTTPVHGGAKDEVEERSCPTCEGNKHNIPIKECPTCVGSGTDKPGFVQHGESQHPVICPTCNGSKKTNTVIPYTPILQVPCPHDKIDTRSKPNDPNATDKIGAYDQNYFEGQRLLPARLFWNLSISSKYHHERKDVDLKTFDGTPREIGSITPPIPPVPEDREPSYMTFSSRPNLLDPDRSRTASKIFKRIKKYFNSKTAAEEESKPVTSGNGDFASNADDFFGKEEEPKAEPEFEDFDLGSFAPEGLTLDAIPPSKRTLSPEEQKRLHGGPITVRQMDESDKLRPFLRNPSKAISNAKSMLKAQKSLSEKRAYMSKMFKGMSDLEAATKYEDKDSDDVKSAKDKKHSLGLRPSYRGWRDNLHKVSENLDIFGQVRGGLRKNLEGVIGKRMDPQVANALTSQAFRQGKKIPLKDGRVIELKEHRLGITEPMPYFKNDENWRETHSGLGCDHDPSEGHEPDVGCIVDYHNPAENPKEGVTTGVNSRLVTGKYTNANGETTLQTVGARLTQPAESGVGKRGLRKLIPKWKPENYGNVVELPADRATCVPNKIQREHYVINHTIEPESERDESTSLPEEETGVRGLKPEPVLAKEKVKFPEDIREGGPEESVYVGNPLYQLNNPFSTQEVEQGMWANNPAVQHIAKQIKDGQRPEKFKPYTPEPKFNSQKMKDRPGLTGPPPPEENNVADMGEIDWNSFFGDSDDDTPPKISTRQFNSLNPIEKEDDETYDFDKKLKVQKMQRTQVHMVEPTNASTPDITPDVPQVNYN